MHEPPPSYETSVFRDSKFDKNFASRELNTRPKFPEIKAFENPKDRNKCEDLSDLFAIIKTMECLEAAYSRDSVSSTEYADSCFKLISQFKTSESALVANGSIQSADAFIREFDIDCPRAYERLIRVGVPATVVHATHDKRGEIVIVAETVQEFITAMDGIKLGIIALFRNMRCLNTEVSVSFLLPIFLPQDNGRLMKSNR
jgi:ESCRT-I complex subunit VPS28